MNYDCCRASFKVSVHVKLLMQWQALVSWHGSHRGHDSFRTRSKSPVSDIHIDQITETSLTRKKDILKMVSPKQNVIIWSPGLVATTSD